LKNPGQTTLAQFEETEMHQLVHVCRQAMHDIRSPLSTLNLIAGTLANISEEKRNLLEHAIERINEIADMLLSVKARTPAPATVAPAQLAGLVSEVLAGKEMEFGRRKDLEFRFLVWIDKDAAPLRIEPAGLKRVLSNLINNSVEAISGSGIIRVELAVKKNKTTLEIFDNGKGIPSDVLERLQYLDLSHDKPNGSALGLSHARKTLAEWGGFLKIESAVNVGTKVTLHF
jgi:signal transduction histidine kinase